MKGRKKNFVSAIVYAHNEEARIGRFLTRSVSTLEEVPDDEG